MNLTIAHHGDECRATIVGSFTFSDNRTFKTLIEQMQEPHLKTCFIDLSSVSDVDSAALGMLMVLLRTCKKLNKRVVLAYARGSVRDIFKLSQFDTLFDWKE